MNLDFPCVARASRLAFALAYRRLLDSGFTGEAERARVMADLYVDDARALLCSSPRCASAPALLVVRQLAAFIRRAVLLAELESRKKGVVAA
jgi:hypothetical protein